MLSQVLALSTAVGIEKGEIKSESTRGGSAVGDHHLHGYSEDILVHAVLYLRRRLLLNCITQNGYSHGSYYIVMVKALLCD